MKISSVEHIRFIICTPIFIALISTLNTYIRLNVNLNENPFVLHTIVC